MFAWLRTITEWIFTNRNRRIVTIVVFANAIVSVFFLLVLHIPALLILSALVSAYAVATLTRERYLTLGASSIAAMQVLLLILLEPAISAPLANAGIILLATSAFTVLMMSMITNIQQQEYYSTVKADRNIVYKGCVNSLLRARGLNNIYFAILRSIQALYGKSAAVFTRDEKGNVTCVDRLPQGLILYESELEAANAAFDDEVADMDNYEDTVGRFGKAYSTSPFLFIPLMAGKEKIAILGIVFSDEETLDDDMKEELSGIIVQASNAVERQVLADRQQEAIIKGEKERIRADFLRAMSHDIRSPLTGIMSACSTLIQADESISPEARHKLLVNIHEEAQWLCQMVENLLSVTRVNEAAASIKKTPELVEDVIGDVAQRCEKRFPELKLNVSTPDEPMLVEMDPTLIIQVLMNLIENAVKYSGTAKDIELTVSKGEGCAVFTVRDHGVGLSQDTIDNLFTPLSRTDTDNVHGLGIGLSICRSVIRAHGGQISGRNNPDSGAEFTFTLPMEELE